MNIFVVDSNPAICASWLDDRRLIKMILETAQLLSTTLRVTGLYDGDEIYKATHANHPCTVWVRASFNNYTWLTLYFKALLDEYTFRWPGRTHKSGELLPIFERFKFAEIDIINIRFINFAKNASMNVDLSESNDVFTAYKNYLSIKWKNDSNAGRTPKFTNRTRPNTHSFISFVDDTDKLGW